MNQWHLQWQKIFQNHSSWNIFCEGGLSSSLSDKQCKKITAGVEYGLCKVHKAIVDGCPPFRPILSATGTLTYEIAKFLVSILCFLTIDKLTYKDTY